MHPEFGTALKEAEAAGVRVLYLPCRVTKDAIYARDVGAVTRSDLWHGRDLCERRGEENGRTFLFFRYVK